MKKAKRETGEVTTAMRALAAPLTRVLVPPTRAYSRGARGRARIAAMNTTKTPPHDGDVEPWYPIGTPGKPWTEAQREEWRASVEAPRRSYADEVLAKLEPLKSRYDVFKYGALPYDADDPERYPLFAVRTRGFDPSNGKPCVLVTGGVHGYETSGVQGAIRFLETKCEDFVDDFNVLVAPCVSPWGYERVQRWNARAVDPNRSFADRSADESKFLGAMVDAQNVGTWMCHVDLHETTDTDETEFRPAKAARDGEYIAPDVIPDGFYTVGDSEDPKPDFQKEIIDAVSLVTHIAPDVDGKIIGEPVTQRGVINYPVRALGLCASVTNARYVTTTEVYPDSPKCTDDECNDAQVAAVAAALTHVKRVENI